MKLLYNLAIMHTDDDRWVVSGYAYGRQYPTLSFTTENKAIKEFTRIIKEGK